MQGPSESERADVRFFAFYVGNGTLFLPREPDEDDVDYLEDLVTPGPRLGQLFAVYAHACAAERRGEPVDPRWRTADRYRQVFRPARPVIGVPARPEELGPCGIAWLDALVRFAADLGESRLEPSLLAGRDYVPDLTCNGTGCGSVLELVMAIFSNALALTGDEEHARGRAAQYVRVLVDPGYSPSPPLTEDETMLWM